MQKTILLSVLLMILDRITSENSSNICDKCSCEPTTTQFILDCKNKSLTEVLTAWPDQNITLVASFGYNNIATLGKLPFSDVVTEVAFPHCGIKTIEFGAFKDVKNVEYIDLSYNSLTSEEIAPEKFRGPYNDSVYEPLAVKILNLAYNQIHSLQYNLFEHMIDLKELNLEGNQLEVLDHSTREAFSDLDKLEVLNLANNDLTELVEDAIKNLTGLKKLNLAKNDLDFVPITLPVISDHLEVLILDGNPILKFLEDDFAYQPSSMPALRELSLNNLERVEYIRPNTFIFLKNLKILRMSNNTKLEAIDAQAFSNEHNIEELYLNNNSLTKLDVNMLNWSSLKVFEINDNPLQCSCALYNISQRLSEQIKRNKNGPTCIHKTSGVSQQVFKLTEAVCRSSYKSHHVATIVRHFEIMRVVLIVSSAFVTAAAFVGVIIAFLRYRRYKMNLNYPFASQVLYNPLNTSYIRS